MYAELASRIAGADTEVLLSRLGELTEERRAVVAEAALIVEQLDARKEYRTDDHATMYGLLRSRLHWSDRECRDILRIGGLITAYPDAGELLHDGRASVANITEIARGFANPRVGDEIEPELGPLLTSACRDEHDDLRAHVTAWERRVDADHRERVAASAHERRHARIVHDRDGADLHASWGELDGITNAEILARFTQIEWESDWQATVEQHGEDASPRLMPRTDAQRRADALTAIFERAASTPPDAKPPQPVVVIHIDHHTATDVLGEMELLPERNLDPFEHQRPVTTDRRCETTDGRQIDPRTAIQVALDGHIRWTIANQAGIPITWGRKRRLFTGAAADAVRSLSTRCTHPGCRVPAGTSQLDHTHPWSLGGPTDPDNAGPRCRRHNLTKNRGFTTWRDPTGTWHTRRPDGTELPWH